MANGQNPFRVGGTVSGRFFTDRAAEIRRITSTLLEPQAKLLVYGPRRMGKSSAVLVARQRLRRKRHPTVGADLSSATTVADMATRVLHAGVQQLRPLWKDVVAEIAGRIRVSATVVVDPSGRSSLALDVRLRDAPLEEQRTGLAEALNVLDDLAGRRKTTIGIALDEFQEIHRFGGEEAEWHLRGVIEKHEHVAYVLVGSQESLIRAMTSGNRAFYKLCEMLAFGPMDEDHLARWIDSRLESHGVEPKAAGPRGAGARIVELAGPRTRDVVQLARAAYQVGMASGRLRPRDVETAMDRVVDEEGDLLRADWERRTALQQNVLRAIAAGEEKLFAAAAIRRYGLRGTAYVASALNSLVDGGIVVKHEEGDYAFDSPYLRRWVVRHALPDVGIVSSGPD